MTAAVSKNPKKKASPHPFALPFSQKRIEAMTDAERRGSVAPTLAGASVAHCRVCGYTPRSPRQGKPDFSFEKTVEHLESRHPFEVYGRMRELVVLHAQTQGNDSQCKFHGAGGAR